MSKERDSFSGQGLGTQDPAQLPEDPASAVAIPRTTRFAPRRSSPAAIVFEEKDGLYWLRGEHLARAKGALGLRCETPAVGFDRLNWSVYVADLSKKRLPIHVVRDNMLFTVTMNSREQASQIHSIAADLTPHQLVGDKEIERLVTCLTRKHSRVGELVRHLRARFARGDQEIWSDPGVLYAYQAFDDVYEVDWDLTQVSHATVDALLLTAHLEHTPLPCQVVPPKPRREHLPRRSAPAIQLSAPVPFGQLRLPL
jgi:hypothetical protein